MAWPLKPRTQHSPAETVVAVVTPTPFRSQGLATAAQLEKHLMRRVSADDEHGGHIPDSNQQLKTLDSIGKSKQSPLRAHDHRACPHSICTA
jgi:hypothetical protein